MNEEIWMADARREAAWDRYLAARPRCADCREAIAQERCLRLNPGEYLCEGCLRFRLVETELISDG